MSRHSFHTRAGVRASQGGYNDTQSARPQVKSVTDTAQKFEDYRLKASIGIFCIPFLLTALILSGWLTKIWVFFTTCAARDSLRIMC